MRAMAGLMLLMAAAGCGGSPSVSPPAATTMNSFLATFLKGQMASAARLTTEGAQSEKTLTGDRGMLKALVVNVAPFTALSKLHWQTHCTGLSCTVTFGPLDTHQIPTLHVRLEAVGGHARLPISNLSPWLASVGRS